MSRGHHKADKRLRSENPAAILGRKGGQASLKKYGKAQLKEWGKLGGRPKKKKPEPCGLCDSGNIPDGFFRMRDKAIPSTCVLIPCPTIPQSVLHKIGARASIETGHHHVAGHSAMYRCPRPLPSESTDFIFAPAAKAIKRDRRKCACRGIPNQVCDECQGPAGPDKEAESE